MSVAWLPGKIFGQTANVWEHPAMNTASGVSYLNNLEKEIIYELNLARTNPAQYAENFIRPLIEVFEGKLMHYPNQIPIMTKEGKRAVEECIKTMKKATAVGVLNPNERISEAANDLVSFQSKNGKVGHIGRNKSTPVDRIEKYGQWEVRIAENISYGNHEARQIVIALLVDDGVPSRGHRKNILNNDFKLVGVATGKHPEYGTMCVMDFAGGFNSH